jgi:hypothetical protein
MKMEDRYETCVVRGCTLCGFDELVVFVNLDLGIDVPFYF